MPSQLLSRDPRAGAVRIAPTERAWAANSRSSLLWPAATVAWWTAVSVLGGLTVVGCWYAVGGEARWDDQRSAMALGIGVLVLTNFASLSLLLAGRRAVGLRRVSLLGDFPAPRTPAGLEQQEPSSGPLSTTLVGSDGRVRYHRADCPLAVGREYHEMSLSQHKAAGRMACGVCRP